MFEFSFVFVCLFIWHALKWKLKKKDQWITWKMLIVYFFLPSHYFLKNINYTFHRLCTHDGNFYEWSWKALRGFVVIIFKWKFESFFFVFSKILCITCVYCTVLYSTTLYIPLSCPKNVHSIGKCKRLMSVAKYWFYLLCIQFIYIYKFMQLWCRYILTQLDCFCNI